MSELLSIGHFSELTGLTVRALRLYDKRGLLRPAMVDFTTGYRYYSLDQVNQARHIHTLRSLHMPLSDIQVLLTAQDQAVVEQQLERHRRWIGERLKELERAMRLLPTADEWRKTSRKARRMDDKQVYRCSFCQKENHEVRRMIAGPKGVIICNECVTLCNEVIAREEQQGTEAKA